MKKKKTDNIAMVDLTRPGIDAGKLFDLVPCALITVDTDRIVTGWNKCAEQIVGYTGSEIIGKSCKLFCAGGCVDVCCLYPGSDDRISSLPRDCRIRRKDGEIRIVARNVERLYGKNGKITGGVEIFHDITDIKQLEDVIIRTSEHERRRMADDLHDSLSQHLTGVAFIAKLLESRLEGLDSELHRVARDITEYINDSIKVTQSIIKSLRPVESRPEGLCVALESLAENTTSMHEVDCRFVYEDDPLVLDESISSGLYNIALESVNNAVRHGKADRITIHLTRDSEFVQLDISDNGTGFEYTDKECDSESMGVKLMRYRAGQIGGKIKISSFKGRGTTITCISRPDIIATRGSEDECRKE